MPMRALCNRSGWWAGLVLLGGSSVLAAFMPAAVAAEPAPPTPPTPPTPTPPPTPPSIETLC